ncbi:hypothetical protein EV193_101283 [Herbihabitans rhizosphaerae]|uniref:DUF2975 family protein n=1 Tax=Herbihabitans rhizosphaerae TaxID=1872711 RepID=A0A4Q7L538_9PSEU|nr:hypothetical protein [Herbihabitans rhizosphaerae]RZS44407.1 hypothetical protein EV193_101283 [Herbihabitans rhizosphaerae]
MQLSRESRVLAGILLLALVAVESGGVYLVRVVGGSVQLTDFQLGFARAGHAHAGVLLILSLVALLYADAIRLSGLAGALARRCVPIAAILMPAGFFAASAGDGRTGPNGFVVLLFLGGLSLACGLIALGVSLLRSRDQSTVDTADTVV